MLSFRFADASDCALILQFIRDLAEYEKSLAYVVATEETIHEWLFVQKKAEVIFAEEDGAAVGFALFFHSFPALYGRCGLFLEDLFVKPECRGRGYGKALLRQLATIARERGCCRLDWVCLDWNQPSIDFYLSLGAKPMREGIIFRMDEGTFGRLAGEA